MSVFLFPFVAWDSIRFSHRIAGPVNRMKQMVQRMADRQTVDPIHIRTGDYAHELVAELNRLAISLRPTAADEIETLKVLPTVSKNKDSQFGACS
jgi:hypothetical protein